MRVRPRPMAPTSSRSVDSTKRWRSGAAVRMTRSPTSSGLAPRFARLQELRGALGEHDGRISTSANGYRLDAGRGELDADRFEQLAREAERLIATGDVATGIDRIGGPDLRAGVRTTDRRRYPDRNRGNAR